MTGHDEQTEALAAVICGMRYLGKPVATDNPLDIRVAEAIRAAGWLSPVEVAARERAAAADALEDVSTHWVFNPSAQTYLRARAVAIRAGGSA